MNDAAARLQCRPDFELGDIENRIAQPDFSAMMPPEIADDGVYIVNSPLARPPARHQVENGFVKGVGHPSVEGTGNPILSTRERTDSGMRPRIASCSTNLFHGRAAASSPRG